MSYRFSLVALLRNSIFWFTSFNPNSLTFVCFETNASALLQRPLQRKNIQVVFLR